MVGGGTGQTLSELSTGLRRAVLRDVGRRKLVEVPLLGGFGDECAGMVATRLEPVALERGDVVYEEGDAASEMFFVVSGAVALSVDAGVGATPLGTAGPGDVFGELGVFPHVLGAMRLETATATVSTALYALSAASLAEVGRGGCLALILLILKRGTVTAWYFFDLQVRAAYPALAARLEELATLRAIRSGAAARARAAGGGLLGAGQAMGGEGTSGQSSLERKVRDDGGLK